MAVISSEQYQARLLATLAHLQDSDIKDQIGPKLGGRGGTAFYPMGDVQLPGEDPLYLGLKLRSNSEEEIAKELQLFEFLYTLGCPVPFLSVVVTNGEDVGILTEDLTRNGELDLTEIILPHFIPDSLDNCAELREQYGGSCMDINQTGITAYGKSYFVAHEPYTTGIGRGCFLDIEHFEFPPDIKELEQQVKQEAPKYLREPLLLRV